MLWPLIDVKISFMLNILWTNWWILIHWYWQIVGKDNYKLFFVIFQLSYGPWLMSEFCFHLMAWEEIDGFWWNFVYAVLWLTHEIYLNFLTELWPLIDVKISIFLNIFRNNEWILIKLCLCRDTMYMIHGVTNTHYFLKFSTELWPLIDFRIMFMHNILWTIWWIWSNLVDTLIFFLCQNVCNNKNKHSGWVSFSACKAFIWNDNGNMEHTGDPLLQSSLSLLHPVCI